MTSTPSTASTRSLPGSNGTKVWVYDLGPFTSPPYKSRAAARAQGTRHAKRGLSPEFWKRYQQRETAR